MMHPGGQKQYSFEIQQNDSFPPIWIWYKRMKNNNVSHDHLGTMHVSFAEFIDILTSDEIRNGVNETHGAMTGLSRMSDPHW
jgi:hypothetical protein